MPGYEVIGSEEANQVAEVFLNGGILFRHGFDSLRNGSYKVAEFEQAFAEYMGVEDALAVTSGTAALRVALAALQLSPGNEVIIPAFTFVATAEAVIEAGAVPVCVEVDASLNLDPQAVAEAIGERTSAVIAVHMLGTPARLREITEICLNANVPLIEDAAWGCGGSLDDRKLGTWGRMGSFSFDFAKTMTTGEGGMLVFSNKKDAQAARAWHDHGHDNNPRVPRWEDTRSSSGFNLRMMELQGAVGLAQLQKLDGIVAAQRRVHSDIWEALSSIPGLVLRGEPSGSFSTCDALTFLAGDPAAAKRIRDALLVAGASTKILPEAVTWHFAAHWSHMPSLVAQHAKGLRGAFPNSEKLLGQSVSLPISIKGSGLPLEIVRKIVAQAMESS